MQSGLGTPLSYINKRPTMLRRATPAPPRGLAARDPRDVLAELRRDGTLPDAPPAPPAPDPLLDMATGVRRAARRPPARPALGPGPEPAAEPAAEPDPKSCLALPRARCGRHPDGEGCSWSWWYGTCLPTDVYAGIGLTGFKTERARRFIHDSVERPMSRALARLGTKVAAVLATFIEFTGAQLPGLARLLEALPPDLLDLISCFRAGVSQAAASAVGLGADAVRAVLGEAAGAMGAQMVELCVTFLGRYLAVTAGVAAMALADEFVDALDALVARHMTPGSLAQRAASGAAGAIRWIGVLVVAAVAATVGSGVVATAGGAGAVSWVTWVFLAGTTLAGRSWGLSVVKDPILLFTTISRSMGWLVKAIANRAASAPSAPAANIEHFEQDRAAAAALRVRVHDLEASQALPPEAAAALREQIRGATDDLAAMTAEAEAAHAETGGVPTALVVRIHARTVAVQAAVAAAVRGHAERLEDRLRDATRELARLQGAAAPDTGPDAVQALRAEVEAVMGALARVSHEPAASDSGPAFARLNEPPNKSARRVGLAVAFQHVSATLLPRARALRRALKAAARAHAEAAAEVGRPGAADDPARRRAWEDVARRAAALGGADPPASERELEALQHMLKVVKSFLVQARVGDSASAAGVARAAGASPRAMGVLADRLASRAWRASVPGGPGLAEIEAAFRRLAGAGLLAAHEAVLLVADARDAEQLDNAVGPGDAARPALLGPGPLDPRLLRFAYGMAAAAMLSPGGSGEQGLLDWARRGGGPFANLRAQVAEAVRSSPELRADAVAARDRAAALQSEPNPSRKALEDLAQGDPIPQVATCAELIAAALGGRALGDALVAVARDDDAEVARTFHALRRELADQRPGARDAVAREVFSVVSVRGRDAGARLAALRSRLDSDALVTAVLRAVKHLLSQVATPGGAGAVLRRAAASIDPDEGASAVFARETGEALTAGGAAPFPEPGAHEPLASAPLRPSFGGPHAARVVDNQSHSWSAAHAHTDATRAHVALPILVAKILTRALGVARARP